MTNKPSVRNSGIEILRILAACGVVILHYNTAGGFSGAIPRSAGWYFLFFMESVSICSVDLFVLISGYFLSGTQKRGYLKIIQLFTELILIREVTFILMILFGEIDFSFRSFIGNLIPDNYYLILYAALYFFSPYLSLLFKNLNQQNWKKMLILLFLIFSVWNTLIDILEQVQGKEWMGLSTIGAWGSQQGFNIVNFTLMYCIGAYLRNFNTNVTSKSWKALSIFWLLDILCIFAWAVICERMHLKGVRSAWVYHNPLVIFSAVLLFLSFQSIRFEGRAKAVINELAKGSFTCYLLHQTLLRFTRIEDYITCSFPILLLHFFLTLACCYVLAWCAYKLYSLITDGIFRKLSTLRFFQEHEIV